MFEIMTVKTNNLKIPFYHFRLIQLKTNTNHATKRIYGTSP